MTIEEEYELSCYRPLTYLREGKRVELVKHLDTGQLFVKKELTFYSLPVYSQLKDHPIEGVPKIYFCAPENGRLLVIEEYIHGRSLQEILDESGTFSEVETAEIVLKLCDILIPLHQCRPAIVHRDIKPSNIMYAADNTVRLIDFNAARQVSSKRFEDTIHMGTPDFAAPEQYGFGQSDQRTDIYALGVTINYLITGAKPSERLCSGPMRRIVVRCTAFDREKRYPDVDALRADILRMMEPFSLAWCRPFLPVGFRSGLLWRSMLAFCGYALVFHLCLTMPFDTSGWSLWVNRFGILFVALGNIFFLGNYAGVRQHLTGMIKNPILRWALNICWMFLLLVTAATIALFLE